jgi:hypothetical protein
MNLVRIAHVDFFAKINAADEKNGFPSIFKKVGNEAGIEKFFFLFTFES